MRIGSAQFVGSVGDVKNEPSAKRKAHALRLALLPFKTYVCGVPLVLLVWWMYFIEPDPPHWKYPATRILERVVAEIFTTVEYGYLVCIVCLGFGTFLIRPIGEVKDFQSARWFWGVALVSAIILYPFSQVFPTK